MENTNLKFIEYYEKWVSIYKDGAIRNVTMKKYLLAIKWLKNNYSNLNLYEINRNMYQTIINKYAETHERQTVMDFHHLIKSSVLDAVEDKLIDKDPTRKIIIKGKEPRQKKIKFLNQFQLHTLISDLNLNGIVNWDYLIFLIAKTGMRFSECLGLTPADFNMKQQNIEISKTYNYKENKGFSATKNYSSNRKIPIDWQTIMIFNELMKNMKKDEKIFVLKKVYNSTINKILERHCIKCKIPIISIHGLRHTHASILLYAGVSIASVARRLGHSSISTTQKTYIHLIQEMENKDIDLVMRSISLLSQ